MWQKTIGLDSEIYDSLSEAKVAEAKRFIGTG